MLRHIVLNVFNGQCTFFIFSGQSVFILKILIIPCGESFGTFYELDLYKTTPIQFNNGKGISNVNLTPTRGQVRKHNNN